MNTPRPTMAIIAMLGMPVAVAENGEEGSVTERTTKPSAMVAIAMASFNILIMYIGLLQRDLIETKSRCR